MTVAVLPVMMLEGIVAQSVDMFAYSTGNMRVVAGLRDAFAIHGGVEVDTQGDAFLVNFHLSRPLTAA